MAGKNPTPANITNIRKKWGFDKPFYVQYVRMMEKVGNGLLPGPHSEYDILRSFDTRQNVVAGDQEGHSRRRSRSASAPGSSGSSSAMLVGVISARRRPGDGPTG